MAHFVQPMPVPITETDKVGIFLQNVTYLEDNGNKKQGKPANSTVNPPLSFFLGIFALFQNKRFAFELTSNTSKLTLSLIATSTWELKSNYIESPVSSD